MWVIGHRGAKGEAPENTIGGLRYALNRGITCFELDVRLSADGVPVVIHDPTTTRTTRKRARVNRLSAGQLANLNAARHERWSISEQIPQLVDVLPLLEQCDTVQLEVKCDRNVDPSQLLEGIREVLHGCPTHHLVLTSSDSRTLQLAQSLLPGLRRGLVWERRFGDVIALSRRLDCHELVIQHRLLSPQLIGQAQAAGLVVSAYTINDLRRIRQLCDWGVDSIITDYPSKYLHLSVAPAIRSETGGALPLSPALAGSAVGASA